MQPARDLPARRATEWLDALAETWQKTELVEEKSDLIHAIYERIVIEGRWAAVLLRSDRLGDQLVPVRRIGAQDLAVAHHHCDAIRVQLVFEQFDGPAQIALPAVRGRAARRAGSPLLAPQFAPTLFDADVNLDDGRGI